MIWWLLRRVLIKLATGQARRMAAAFEAATHHPREVQDAVRRRILEKQRDTAFGRDHRFQDIHSLADFREQLPVLCYEDLEPYVARMRRGELNALVSEPVVHMFAMTSGTTASRKYIPVTPQYLADYRRGWSIWGMTAAEKHTIKMFRGILQVVSDWDEFRTEAGIPCGSVSGLTAHMQKWLIRRLYTMPAIAGRIKDSHAKYYTALRLALAREVRMVTSANPSTLVNLARLMDQEKESLIRDIHDGTLSERYKVPADVREGMRKKIGRGNPRRAKDLDAVVRRTGTLYPKDAWPELKILGNWMGGSVGAYLRHYPRYYGQTPVRDLGLLASEGRFTIPLEDGTPAGVLEITSHFFEFIPRDEIDSPQPTVLLADELKEGREYFILPTTSYGLYRYNIYDVIRVVGFHNRTPVIEFLNKGAHFANLTGEKLSEHHVTAATQEALREFDATVSTYTVAPCWDDDQPFYGIFLERGELGGLHRARDFAAAVDRHLRRLNPEYDGKRESGRLGSLQAMLLPSGAWVEWDQQRLNRSGGTPEQYKHPCLVPDPNFRKQVPVLEECFESPQPVA